MQLDEAEKRVLQAALREFVAAVESDFRTIRECHSFLFAGDEQVDVKVLAQKLGVNITEE